MASADCLRRPNHLEGLPVELQLLILQAAPDVPTLYALVRSSPVFYTTYISGQRSILLAVLSTELTLTVLRESCAGLRAVNIRRGDDGSEDDVWTREVYAFLNDYSQYCLSPKVGNAQLSGLPLDKATLLHISHNHSSVRTVTLDFCKSTLSLHPITGQDTPFQELSQNEKRRIYRACYRFELFCKLFGRLVYESSSVPEWGFYPGSRISSLFLSKFNLWEVEEIASIHDYINMRYDQIFKECETQLLDMYCRQEGSYGYAGQSMQDMVGRMRNKSNIRPVIAFRITRLTVLSVAGVPKYDRRFDEQGLKGLNQHHAVVIP
jgi:hypothetical protein